MAKVKPAKKTKKLNKGTVIIAVAVILLIAALIGITLVNSGTFFRAKKGASSDNFEINASMMEYYTQSYIQNWYSQNYYYILLGYIKFSTSTPYDQQYTDAAKTQTYYDYFVEGTKTAVTAYLKYCEAAKADGTVDFAKLENEAKAYADDIIESLKEAAEQASNQQYETNGMTITFDQYIKNNFGKNVNKDDLHKALVIEHIASSYYQTVYDRINGGITSEREDKYFEDNISSFVSAEYLMYTLSSTKTVTWPKAEDYVGGANSVAYKAAIEGLTTANAAKINVEDYEGGAESKAYQEAYKTAVENKMTNDNSIARDKEIIEKLAACTTAEEFKRVLLEEKYDANFESAYNNATSSFATADKPSEDALNAFKNEALKSAIIEAVLAGETEVNADLIVIAEGSSTKWTDAAKALPKSIITNLKKVISDATKPVNYTLTSVLGNKLFGGVKAEYGIEYEETETQGTNALVNSAWMEDVLVMNVENYKIQKKVTEAAIAELVADIAEETDADLKKALEDSKKALEDSLAKIEENITKGEEKIANFEKTGEYSYSAFFVTEAAHRDDYKLRNVGHILFKVDTTKETDAKVSYKTSEEAKAAAEALLNTIKGETDLTKEKFEEYGKVTHDSNVFYDEVAKGDMVEAFEEWLFDAETVGEVGLVETTYGWHIMFYNGETDKIAWRVTAKDGATNEDMSNWFDELPSYGISFNDEIFAEILLGE